MGEAAAAAVAVAAAAAAAGLRLQWAPVQHCRTHTYRRHTRLLPLTQERLASPAGKPIFYPFCPETVGKGMIMETMAHQTCLKWIMLICLLWGGGCLDL